MDKAGWAEHHKLFRAAFDPSLTKENLYSLLYSHNNKPGLPHLLVLPNENLWSLSNQRQQNKLHDLLGIWWSFPCESSALKTLACEVSIIWCTWALSSWTSSSEKDVLSGSVFWNTNLIRSWLKSYFQNTTQENSLGASCPSNWDLIKSRQHLRD